MQNGKPTDRMPLRHLARFILFGLYTGSRPGDTLLASYYVSSDRGYVDLEQGLYYRKPPRKRSTNKRQPTTPLPTSLLSHLRRWRERGDDHVVQFNSAPIQSVKTAFEKALKAAKLDETDVIPYTLRHTRATWMKQAGVPSWEVAGYLGTSEAMIEKHYGHHDPNHLKAAANSSQRLPNDTPGTEREKKLRPATKSNVISMRK